MTRPPYKAPTRGLGIQDWLKRRIALSERTFPMGMALFKGLVLTAPLSKLPGVGRIYKRLTMISRRRWTQGYVVPLDIDLGGLARPAVLPIDLLKKAIRESSYRAMMKKCICRSTWHCQDYPQDMACIFLGQAATTCVAKGIAVEATVEECEARVDEAARLGLPGKAYWVELESLLWGFENQKMDHFLEICFCCPCCCAAHKFADRADEDAGGVLHHSLGWTARVGEACTACGLCVKVCPRHALRRGDPVSIDPDACVACGRCIPVCPSKALRLEQVAPLKPDLRDYFEGLDLKT